MTYDESPRTPRAPIALVAVVALCFLFQIGALVSQVLADTGGGAASTSIAPDVLSDQVAATAAQFRVDESGAATYSIPLYAVPGTAGVAPKLSLNYSSQGSYGPLGKGWSINGSSSISRCRATREAGDFIVGGVATDGTPTPINYTSTDRYCLDGQRLLPVADGPACPSAGGRAGIQYRTEIESFQRVCAYSGSNDVAFFTVERKDGSISWYGDRDNSASADRPDGFFNSTSPGKEAFALSWAQTRFQDSTGNYIDFVYLQNPAGTGTGEQLLSEVRYTGKTVLAGQSGVASLPYAKVMFNYSQRAPAQWGKGYASGGILTQSQRLDSVTSCAVGTGGACAVSAQARHYRLTYGPAASGSPLETLSSLQECRDSSGSVCLPATRFNWSQGKYEFATRDTLPNLPTGSASKFHGFKMGDVDGDGRPDIVYLKDGPGGNCPQVLYVLYGQLDASGNLSYLQDGGTCTQSTLSNRGEGGWQLVDYDGDGRADLFMSGAVGGSWVVYHSNGRIGGITFDTSHNLIAALTPSIPAYEGATDQVQLADLNGDGLIDIVYASNSGTRVRLMERQGASFGWGAERNLRFNNTAPPTMAACSDSRYEPCYTGLAGITTKTGFMQLADFNGGASSGLLVRTFEDAVPTGVGCQLPITSGPPALVGAGGPSVYMFATPPSATTTATTSTYPMCPPERVQYHTQATIVQAIDATSVTIGTYAAIQSDVYAVSLVDINGDGLTDLFYRDSSTSPWAYRVNTGSGMAPAVSMPLQDFADQVRFADVNGDGRTDVLHVVNPGNAYKTYNVLYALPSGGFSAETWLPGGNNTNGNALLCDGSGCDETARSPIFADLDGDGAMDFMSLKSGDNAGLYVSRATTRFAPRDVMTQITNGLGTQTNITYGALTNKDLYRRDVGSRDGTNWGRGAPVLDVLSSSYAVQQVSSSSPGAPSGFATLYYRYAGAKVQAGGRGFLGFHEIATIDPNESGGYVTTTTTYNQAFPYTGMPSETIERAAIGQTFTVPACFTNPANDACFAPPGQAFPALPGNTFSDNSQIWESDTEIAGATTTTFARGVQAPVHVRTSGSQEIQWDPGNGSLKSRVYTSFVYGAYGNVTRTAVDTYTGSVATSVATTNDYAADDISRWRLGRLTTSSVTFHRPGMTDVVRTSSFGYSSNTGILNQERVQPGGAVNQDLVKVYNLDDYGNRIQATACAAPASSCSTSGLVFHPAGSLVRTTRSAYDSRGRYPVASYERFWAGSTLVDKNVERATQTVVARDIFGDATQAYDLNGRDTLAVPGTFGRSYYSWAETTPGSVPGAVAGGLNSFTTYRWCGTGSNQVSCPAGAVFRQKVTADGAPSQWSYFDVLGRSMLKAAETFNTGISGKDIAASCTTYDATSKPKQVSNPFFLAGVGGSDGPSGLSSVCTTGRDWTTTTYDVLGRPVSVVSPDSSRVSNTYSGMTTTSTDARGLVTTQTRNANGELTQITDANGLVMTYGYGADGTQLSVSRNAGRGVVVNSFVFDVSGRKTLQSDQDGGVTRFEYNAFGEVTAQQDSTGNRIENEIDARGRVWRKTVKLSNGTIESQSTYNFDVAANGIGQLESENITGMYSGWVGAGQPSLGLKYSRTYSYDALGRPLGNITGIDGVNYTAAVQYDTFGRPWKAQDVSGNWIKTEYTSRGMGAAVCYSSATDNVSGCASPWQRTGQTDAWGHVLNEVRSGTGQMPVTRTYDPLNGRAKSICADNSSTGPCNLVDEHYGWDADGNLSTLQKDTRYLETLSYDSLNRLTLAQVSMQDGVPSSTVLDSVSYDMLGNICRKVTYGQAGSDFTYVGRSGCGLGGANSTYGSGGTGAVGAHQVGGLNGSVFYYYDARGNQTIKNAPSATYSRTISYSVDDKAYEAGSGTGVRTRFWYGSDGQRYKREDTSATGTKRTLYLGNVEIVTDAATTTVKRTIAGVMLQTITGSAVANQYLFHDQLGSVVRITDGAGGIINSQDFEAFGGRRDYTSHTAGGPAPSLTTRGYTGHEMVDSVLGLIHMNGRIFDPGLGRFLQTDPLIQSPGDAQSWNAYTYVLNNPYRYTDPSGYSWYRPDEGLIHKIMRAQGPQVTQYSIIIGSAFAGPWAPVVAGIGTYDMNRAFGASMGQSLRSGLIAAGTAEAFSAVGGYFKDAGWATSGEHVFGTGLNAGGFASKVAIEASLGGISSELSGGNFGDGFVSAGVSAGFSGAIDHIDSGNDGVSPLRIAASAILGGTTSVITGGKFANGAITAAFQRAFNEEHEYRLGPSRMCYTDQGGCTLSNALDATDAVSVPFVDNPPGGYMRIGPFNDPIFHYVDRENYTITNYAMPGHHFFPGKVVDYLTIRSELSFSFRTGFYQREAIYLSTVGTGSGSWWAANDAIGYTLFSRTHIEAPIIMQQYLKKSP